MTLIHDGEKVICLTNGRVVSNREFFKGTLAQCNAEIARLNLKPAPDLTKKRDDLNK